MMALMRCAEVSCARSCVVSVISFFFSNRKSRQSRLAAVSNAFQHQRNALAHADAHGAQGIAATRAVQLVDGRQSQPRTGSTQRMTERNRAAIRVDARIVVAQAQLADH